ncbi:MAG: hypothetical protein V4723_10405, partial [Pseudomonadota bacterium]
AAQLLDLARFGRQDIGDIFRQEPIRHGQKAVRRLLNQGQREAHGRALNVAPNHQFYPKMELAWREMFI